MATKLFSFLFPPSVSVQLVLHLFTKRISVDTHGASTQWVRSNKFDDCSLRLVSTKTQIKIYKRRLTQGLSGKKRGLVQLTARNGMNCEVSTVVVNCTHTRAH